MGMRESADAEGMGWKGGSHTVTTLLMKSLRYVYKLNYISASFCLQVDERFFWNKRMLDDLLEENYAVRLPFLWWGLCHTPTGQAG